MSFFGKILKRKEKRKETLLELICTVVSCWLLSVGTALILDSQFTIQIGIGAILWQTAVATLAVFLMTRRWWIPIIYFGILIPVFFLTVSFSGDLISFFRSIASFFEWWLGGMPIESSWYTAQGYYLIHTCMNIGVSIMYFAIARITKKAWFSVGVALAFIITNYAFGYTGYHDLTIPFFIVGIFPLIAGEKFQKIKIPDFKDVFGLLGKKWLMIVVSTVIAVLVSATSLFVMSNTNGSVRNRFCTNIIFDFQTLSDTYSNEQRKVNLTLFDLGLAMNSTFIGGNLYDIDEEVIATTNLTEATRIKVTAYDTFDGQNWTAKFEKLYRTNGFLWEEEQKQYLTTYLLNDAKFMADVKRASRNKTITFTMKTNENFLPTVGQITKFEELTPTKNPVSFDSRGRFISLYPQPKGYTYSIDSIIYDTNSDTIEAKMNALLGMYTFIEDPNYDKNSEFYKHYTEPIVDKLPTEAVNILNPIKDNQYNEFQKAKKISDYFTNQKFSYVKKPDTFDKGDNIVDKLFSTKRGHCMYFATAMVAMARDMGIPSRLVAGYVTVPGSDKKTQVVNASSPYAWVECYMPNIGWVSFDPSPSNELTINKVPDGIGDQDDMPDLEIETDIKKEVSGTHLEWSTELTKMLPLIIALVLVALVIILFIVYIITSQSYYKLERVRKRFKTNDKQAKYYYADIVRQFGWLGFKMRKGDTIRETADRAIESLSSNYSEAISKAITAIEALYYGNEIPSDEQIEEIYNARRILENTLKDKNNVFGYIVKRRMLLPIATIKTAKIKK